MLLTISRQVEFVKRYPRRYWEVSEKGIQESSKLKLRFPTLCSDLLSSALLEEKQ